MALAYTAPTWTDGSGEGISASNLQAISNCIEGLVQGSDKAVHGVQINGSTITLVYADGTTETFQAVDLKGIADIDEVIVDRDHDFTITFTDGTTYSFTITDGRDGTGTGDMEEANYDPDGDVKTAGGIPDYVAGAISGKADDLDLDEWTSSVTASTSGSDVVVVFDNLDDSLGYFPYFDDELIGIKSMTKGTGAQTGTIKLTYVLDGATSGTTVGYLRILK